MESKAFSWILVIETEPRMNLNVYRSLGTLWLALYVICGDFIQVTTYFVNRLRWPFQQNILASDWLLCRADITSEITGRWVNQMSLVQSSVIIIWAPRATADTHWRGNQDTAAWLPQQRSKIWRPVESIFPFSFLTLFAQKTEELPRDSFSKERFACKISKLKC